MKLPSSFRRQRTFPLKLWHWECRSWFCGKRGPSGRGDSCGREIGSHARLTGGEDDGSLKPHPGKATSWRRLVDNPEALTYLERSIGREIPGEMNSRLFCSKHEGHMHLSGAGAQMTLGPLRWKRENGRLCRIHPSCTLCRVCSVPNSYLQ